MWLWGYFGYGSYMVKKSNQMSKGIWLSGYQSKQDNPLISKICLYGGYFGYGGVMVKK